MSIPKLPTDLMKFPTLCGKPIQEVDPAWCKEKRFPRGCRFFMTLDRKTVFLGVRDDGDGDYKLPKRPLDYLIQRIEDGAVEEGYVAFLDYTFDGSPTNSVREVVEAIGGTAPRHDVNIGPFWWFSTDCQVIGGNVYFGFAPEF
jgi:hypothetical protein